MRSLNLITIRLWFFMEVRNILFDLTLEKVIGANKGIAKSCLNGIFGGWHSPRNFLLMLNLIQPHYVEVSSTSLIGATLHEMLL